MRRLDRVSQDWFLKTAWTVSRTLLAAGWLAVATACPAASLASAGTSVARATLALLETTDLHTHVLGFDYFRLADDPSAGLDRTATLIHQARAEFPNTLLVDAGDTIEGTALADYQAQVQAPGCRTPIAIVKAMNLLRYDAATVGNHEFNYGLNWLARSTGSPFGFGMDLHDADSQKSGQRCAGPNFPLVLANVVGKQSGRPLFAPFVILNRTVQAIDSQGQAVQRPLKIGLIGFTPPQIMVWDKRWLDGKLSTTDTLAAAKKYIPQMRKAGADLIVVVSHGGLDATAYKPGMESANYHLLKEIPGIDALLMGHSHQVFPDANSTAPGFNAPGVDKVAGTVHGVPAVMAGFWGKYLGVIQLALTHDGRHWRVDTAATQVQARPTMTGAGQYVPADAVIAKLIAKEHQQAKDHVQTAIGRSDFAMSSYFADLGDVSALQVVNMAQADFVTRYVQKNLPELADLPVLSMTAAFKSGFAGPADYTDIAPGRLAIHHAADLYPYPNTAQAVELSGDGVKRWLESAARRFNQIDPQLSSPQELISRFPGYNFDMLTSPDVSYEIDVSQPVGKRIHRLNFKGKPMQPGMRFIVATNNYRASGGGGFPALESATTVMASMKNNRDVVIDYVTASQTLSRQVHGAARSWRFTPIDTAGQVVFHAPAGKSAVAIAAGLSHVHEIQPDDGTGRGMALYQVLLAQ